MATGTEENIIWRLWLILQLQLPSFWLILVQ
jgi:hypothetical protein